jgi:hypothetical protein
MPYAAMTEIDKVFGRQFSYPHVVSRDRRAAQIGHGAVNQDDSCASFYQFPVRLCVGRM